DQYAGAALDDDTQRRLGHYREIVRCLDEVGGRFSLRRPLGGFALSTLGHCLGGIGCLGDALLYQLALGGHHRHGRVVRRQVVTQPGGAETVDQYVLTGGDNRGRRIGMVAGVDVAQARGRLLALGSHGVPASNQFILMVVPLITTSVEVITILPLVSSMVLPPTCSSSRSPARLVRVLTTLQ